MEEDDGSRVQSITLSPLLSLTCFRLCTWRFRFDLVDSGYLFDSRGFLCVNSIL